MTQAEKLQLDIRDFWRIHDGLEAYAGLSPEQIVKRLNAHPEDAFCHLYDLSGSGELMCTRDAQEAIFSLAERHMDSLSVPNDYSVEELEEGIRMYFARALVEEKTDEQALSKVLAAALEEANIKHVERTYHFPCILVSSKVPPQFQVGPVVFTTALEFPQFMAEAFERYAAKASDAEYAAERIEEFKKHILSFGWVATVAVPPCSKESAQSRAELAVSTAINLLRLLIGVPHARDMRLAHGAHSRPSRTQHAVEQNATLHLIQSSRASEALLEDDWYPVLKNFEGFWERAEHILFTTVQGKRSEIANRVIDALNWFGEAAFEPAPGTQIVKFVFALERLTTTQRLATRFFCARVALLAHQGETDFERCFWDAQTIYNARSRVVHGNVSPTSADFQKHLRLAHHMTRNALFRGLEVHCRLDDCGSRSTLSDLSNFFQNEQEKKKILLAKLYSEFSKKRNHNVGG